MAAGFSRVMQALQL